MNQVVFAEPTNMAARALAPTPTSSSATRASPAIWRNVYLMAAQELRARPAEAAGHYNPRART